MRSDRVLEELWTEVHDIVQEAMIKTIRKERWSEEPYKQLRKEEKLKAKEKRKDIPI